MTELNPDAVAESIHKEPFVVSTPSKAVNKRIKKEPARWVSLIGALIALGVAFGLELNEEQVGAIVSVVILLIGEVTRGKVKPADVE